MVFMLLRTGFVSICTISQGANVLSVGFFDDMTPRIYVFIGPRTGNNKLSAPNICRRVFIDEIQDG